MYAKDIQNSIVESPQHTRRRMTSKASKSKTSKASRSGSKSSTCNREEETCVTIPSEEVNSCPVGSIISTGFSQFETISPGESRC